jgi:proteasome lid subunit RPN8/RPN11
MMRIHEKVKKELESFLGNCYGEEVGGFLLRNYHSDLITNFVAVPNEADDKRHSFSTNWKAARNFASNVSRSKRSTSLQAFFHSHPEPCIMSAADVGATEIYKDLDFVTISLVGSGFKKEYIWYACRGVTPIKVVFTKPNPKARGRGQDAGSKRT